jgi:anti-anti-sigma factor
MLNDRSAMLHDRRAAGVALRSSVPSRLRRALDASRLAWAKRRRAPQNVTLNTTGSGVHVLMLDGDIHADSADKVGDRIRAALKLPGPGLVVDLRGATCLDSSVLGVMITGLREAHAQGRAFAVVRPEPSVWRVFELTGLSSDLPSFSSLQAALESIPWRPDVVAHELPAERRPGRLTDRQERALAALYWTGAFDPERGQPVNALVRGGYLADSRYAGPLAALADLGLVENRQGLLRRNWNGTTTWWLTEKGREAAREFL